MRILHTLDDTFSLDVLLIMINMDLISRFHTRAKKISKPLQGKAETRLPKEGQNLKAHHLPVAPSKHTASQERFTTSLQRHGVAAML